VRTEQTASASRAQAQRTAKYASLILDVDSTLCEIEGIEWLAARRDAATAEQIVLVTEAAMRGDISFSSVYGARLEAVRPTHDEVAQLAAAYVDTLSPGARDALAAIRAAGIHVVIVSGGLRQAVLPVAAEVGIPEHDVHAVDVFFGEDGSYTGFANDHPCAQQNGKAAVVRTLDLRAPILAVGDGITDAELKPVISTFVAFIGVIARDPVIERADHTVRTFAELVPLVLHS
jgi:phosphoserine phosphatase